MALFNDLYYIWVDNNVVYLYSVYYHYTFPKCLHLWRLFWSWIWARIYWYLNFKWRWKLTELLITRSLLLINCNLKSTRKWINCNLRKITWCDEGKIIFLQSTKNNIDFMVMLLCCWLPAIIKYGTKAYQQL